MSISKVEIFDIEPLRYRRIFDIEASKIDIDSPRYRRNIDIEVQNFDIVISRYRTKRRYREMPIRYLYTISKIFCFDIDFRVLRYRCFFVGSSLGPGLPTRYRTQIAVCTLHCKSIITRCSCAAWAALSRRSGGCTPRRGRTRCTGRSTGRSCRSERRSA